MDDGLNGGSSHADPQRAPRRARSGPERGVDGSLIGSRTSEIAVALVLLLLLGGLHLVTLLLRAEPTGDRLAVGSPPRPEPAPDVVPRASGRAPAPACIDGADRAVGCGISPPTRRGLNREGYDVLTVTGERLVVALPRSLAPDGGPVVIQDVPIGRMGEPGDPGLRPTTAAPREAAARSCGPCRPTAVTRSTLANGAVVTEWRLESEGRRAHLATIRMGVWTVTLEEVAPVLAEFVAGVLEWRLEDGFLVLDSRDPTYPVYEDWAGVRIDVPSRRGRYWLMVTPGCELSEKRPDLGRADVGPHLRPRIAAGIRGGDWCVGGRYWVQARNLEGPRLRAVHDGLEVRPGPGPTR